MSILLTFIVDDGKQKRDKQRRQTKETNQQQQ
jgi:hypothetical protein